jgi:hypothetical protein
MQRFSLLLISRSARRAALELPRVVMSVLFLAATVAGCGSDSTSPGERGEQLEPGCFSPEQNVDQAYEPGAKGCPCDAEPDVCVELPVTAERPRGWQVALTCEAGRWIGVEDGACWEA